MTMINRLLRIATAASARRRERDYIAGVLQGPNTAFRSELIEVMSRAR